MRFRTALGAALVGVVLLSALGGPGQAQDLVWLRFQQYLDSLRRQSDIPGLSAVIVKDGQVVWAGGSGYQDFENRISATARTPVPIDGLTQTLSTALLLRCAEWGRLSLDDRIGVYNPQAPDTRATLRELASHQPTAPPRAPGTPASAAPPPTFAYDIARVAQLTPALDFCFGQPFRLALATEVFAAVDMSESVPGADLTDAEAVEALPEESFDAETIAAYRAVLGRMAVPYQVDAKGKATPSAYVSRELNAATGVVTTALDLAKFEIALDPPVPPEGTPEEEVPLPWLLPATQALVRSPALGATDVPLPHGLGWFVQDFEGQQLVWQFGVLPDASSALIIKAPARRLTMILLANSDRLVTPFALEAGDVTQSIFARLFIRLFL